MPTLKRESLVSLRTSRDVRSSLAVHRPAPSLRSLQGLEDAVEARVSPAYLHRLLQGEVARLARQELAICRSQQKLLQARQNLKNRKYINEQLTAVRRQVMAARAGRAAQPAVPPVRRAPAVSGQVPVQALPLKY